MEVIPIEMPTGYEMEPHIQIFVVRLANKTYLIDTSTHFANHRELLQSKLTRLGVQTLDKLFLTHSHPDHSGNARSLKDAYPGVEIIIHQAGANRLKQGTMAWMQEAESGFRLFFQRFGNPRKANEPLFPGRDPNKPKPIALPVEPDTILTEEMLLEEMDVFFTPGHSVDHICYGIDDHFFGGDTVLRYIPGMESAWVGAERTLIDFLKTAKRLCRLSSRFAHIHTFHGKSMPSLEFWYHKLIVPRMIGKYQKLISVLRVEEPQTLYQMMHFIFPKWVEHHIYLTQMMGLLELLVLEGMATREEDNQGAWQFKLRQNPDPDFMKKYLTL